MIRAFAWGLGIVAGIVSLAVALLVGFVAVIRVFAARWRVILVWALAFGAAGGVIGFVWWHQYYSMLDPEVRRERFFERARSGWPCDNHIGTAGPEFNDCVGISRKSI